MATRSSILENPMDRGAWSASVHGVPKCQTQLKRLSAHTQIHTHLLHKTCTVTWPKDPALLGPAHPSSIPAPLPRSSYPTPFVSSMSTPHSLTPGHLQMLFLLPGMHCTPFSTLNFYSSFSIRVALLEPPSIPCYVCLAPKPLFCSTCHRL